MRKALYSPKKFRINDLSIIIDYGLILKKHECRTLIKYTRPHARSHRHSSIIQLSNHIIIYRIATSDHFAVSEQWTLFMFINNKLRSSHNIFLCLPAFIFINIRLAIKCLLIRKIKEINLYFYENISYLWFSNNTV